MSTLREIKVKTAPSVEPVTLANVKSWLKIKTTFTDDDTLISDTLIPAARKQAEKFLNRSLITQTLQGYWQSYDEKVYLPFAPVQSIIQVDRIYLNTTTLLTVNNDYYVQGLDDKWLIMTNPKTQLKAGFSPHDRFHVNELQVEYKTGYGDAATNVPEGIREAILMMVANSYSNRKDQTNEAFFTIPDSARKKLMPYKYFAI